MRQTAFALSSDKALREVFGIAAAAFRFDDSPHLFVDHVQKKVKERKFAEAAKVAELTGLKRQEYVHDFLLPLAFISCDVMAQYLAKATSLQAPLVEVMMQLNENAEVLKQRLSLYPEMPEINVKVEYVRSRIDQLNRMRIDAPNLMQPQSMPFQPMTPTLTEILKHWICKRKASDAGDELQIN